MSEEKLPWSATTCEVCEGSGKKSVELGTVVEVEPRELVFTCWYCKGTGWYEAAL